MQGPTLFTREGRGRYRPASTEEICLAAVEVGSAKVRGTVYVTAPSQVRKALLPLGALDREIFGALWLDNRHRLIRFEILFLGTIDGASVHPREVARSALANNAAAVIFVHNHPSGVPDPSDADQMITRRLRDALSLLDVRVLDHLIIAGDTSTSFAERGMI